MDGDIPALACVRVCFDVERSVQKNERQISMMILDRSGGEDLIGTFDEGNAEGKMFVHADKIDFREELDRYEEAGKIIGRWITKWNFCKPFTQSLQPTPLATIFVLIPVSQLR